jgi:hypothetical protein
MEKMDTERLVSITISVPKSYRDQLRRIVAQSNLENLDRAMNISRMGREIILAYLNSLNEEQTKGNANDRDIPITNKGGE